MLPNTSNITIKWHLIYIQFTFVYFMWCMGIVDTQFLLNEKQKENTEKIVDKKKNCR